MVIHFCRTLWRLSLVNYECLVLHPCSQCCIEFHIWIHLGTHISNTREAKAFALLSEEGIAKGIRRITAVTTDCAFKAMELAYSLEQEVNDASKIEASQLEKVFFFFPLVRSLLAFVTCSHLFSVPPYYSLSSCPSSSFII